MAEESAEGRSPLLLGTSMTEDERRRRGIDEQVGTITSRQEWPSINNLSCSHTPRSVLMHWNKFHQASL